MITKRKSTKLIAVLAGVSLIAAACGDDDEPGDTSPDTSEDGTTPPGTTPDGTTPMTGDTTPPGTGDTTPMTGDTTPMTGDTTATTGDDTATTGDDTAPTGGSFTYGYGQEFSDYNNNSIGGNSVKNGIVLNGVLPDTFYFSGPDGALVMDENLMESVTLTSEDPQIVEYVVNPDAVWSDGDPIDCDDYQLAYMANNGKYIQQEDGAPVTDPESGLELPVFATAGTTGYEQIETVECSEDGKTFTTTYATPYPDWQGLFGNIVPAHILEQESGVEDIGALLESEDQAQLEAAGEFWNTGWTLEPGQLKEDIMPSGDAFIIDSWEAGQTLTLVPNESYWGPPPQTDEIVIRILADTAQAQALANGEILAMDPQPNADLLAQLEGVDGVTVETGEAFTFEHFDFNFRNEALKNRDVREAFAKCLPRQQMVDELIKPLNPEAEVLNNRWFESFEPGYQDNSGGEYDEVDIEGATALLEGSGVELPLQLRIGWLNDPEAPNLRRANEVALTKQSCDQAGFEIVDAGTPTFFDVELPEGNYDIAMFAWAGSALKTGSASTYQKGGGNNLGRYSNPDVDALIEELSQELDPARVEELANEVDTILWEDLATIPVFTFPNLVATAENAGGVVANPAQNGLTWNAEQWTVS
ncbi:ABC transporter family substrate-binding protein [soil metagenome]